MILYIGTKQNGFFVEEVAKNYNHSVRYTAELFDVNQILEESLKERTDYIIVDTGAMIFVGEEIVNIISRIKETQPESRIIIFSQGGNEKSDISVSLKKIGITDFLFSFELGVLKSELGKILDPSNPQPEPEESNIEETNSTADIAKEIGKSTADAEVAAKMKKETVIETIAVAGSISRIGTTTQALQIAKYLQSCGKKVCYIECNDTGYLHAMQSFYTDVITARKDRITYSNIDMIPCENAAKVRGEEYDCYIYDYGLVEKMNAALLSTFLEKDKKVIVGGVSPLELVTMSSIVQKFFDSDVDYIFSFVSESDREEAEAMMEEKKDRVYFAEYAPDPFFFSSKSIPLYNQLLKEELREKEQESKKQGFFKKWKGREK